MSAHLGSVTCSDCNSDAATEMQLQYYARNRQIAVLRDANLNSTSDQEITIPVDRWIVHRIYVANSSADASACVGGIYTGAGKTGTQVVAASATYTGVTGPTKFKDLALGTACDDTVFTSDTVYLSLTTPAGLVCTGDIFIEFDELDPLTVVEQLDAAGNVCEKIITIPGPKGNSGDDGSDGSDGANAYTETSAQFIQPSASATVVVSVLDGSWAAVGMIVYVSTAGYYEVTAQGALTMTLKNLNYDSNVPPATVIGAGVKIVPAGEKGQETGTTADYDTIAPTTTKGDVPVHNGTTNVRLPVGVDNHMVLRVDGTTATGLLWERINLGTWALTGSLPVASGGTGAATASAARTNLGAAKNGINTDITQINGLSRILVDTTNGSAVNGIFSNTATLDFPNTAAASSSNLTISVPGAAVNDPVILGLPASPSASFIFQAFVSAANTVTVRATNITAAPVDPASATYRVTVISHA